MGEGAEEEEMASRLKRSSPPTRNELDAREEREYSEPSVVPNQFEDWKEHWETPSNFNPASLPRQTVNT